MVGPAGNVVRDGFPTISLVHGSVLVPSVKVSALHLEYGVGIFVDALWNMLYTIHYL